MKYLIVKTTVENYEDAEVLSKRVVESRLGACVQISEIKSIYRWKGKIEEAKEFKLEIKTSASKYEKLKNFIINNTKYELPEIISIKIDKGYDKYLNWINN